MSIVERLGLEKLGFARRRPIALVVAQTDVAVAAGVEEASALQRVLAQPELMDEQSHPLRFYPGFDEFVSTWNAHASSPTRISVQQRIIDCSTVLNQNGAYSTLEAEADRTRASKAIAERAFQAIPLNTPKIKEREALKRARRHDRRVRERLGREAPARSRVLSDFYTATADLNEVDYRFAIEGDERHLAFFVRERIGNDWRKIDELVRRYKGINASREFRIHVSEANLMSVNARILAVLQRGAANTEDWNITWEKARAASRRQLLNAADSGTRTVKGRA